MTLGEIGSIVSAVMATLAFLRVMFKDFGTSSRQLEIIAAIEKLESRIKADFVQQVVFTLEKKTWDERLLRLERNRQH